MNTPLTPAQHAELKRRVAHAQQLREDRDLAHEADMRELRREQLRADVDDAEDYLGDPDEYDYE